MPRFAIVLRAFSWFSEYHKVHSGSGSGRMHRRNDKVIARVLRAIFVGFRVRCTAAAGREECIHSRGNVKVCQSVAGVLDFTILILALLAQATKQKKTSIVARGHTNQSHIIILSCSKEKKKNNSRIKVQRQRAGPKS